MFQVVVMPYLSKTSSRRGVPTLAACTPREMSHGESSPPNDPRLFSFFQMVKVLDFMGLRYKDILYKKNNLCINDLYKEDSNVLSYYVITAVLINNYQDFLSWCDTNNSNMLNFDKTSSNLNEYCKFIESKYNKKNMLDGIECVEKLLNNMKIHKKDYQYMLENLRMTICELG